VTTVFQQTQSLVYLVCYCRLQT